MTEIEQILVLGQIVLSILVIYCLLLLYRWQKIWKKACQERDHKVTKATIKIWQQRLAELPVNSPKWKAYKANLKAHGH